jgi:hypothetical protein
MVYVDPLCQNGWVLRGRSTTNCHMFADDINELHELATRIGMKIEWFQDDSKLPHYDLTPSRRAAAILAGAKEVTRRQLVEFMRARR